MSKKNTAQMVSLEKLHIVGPGPGPVSVGHEVCGTQGPGSNTPLPGGKACCAKKNEVGWAGGAGATLLSVQRKFLCLVLKVRTTP